MKTVKAEIKEIPMLGIYTVVNCERCGKKNGNWIRGIYGYVDCDCILAETGGRFRTLMKFGVV